MDALTIVLAANQPDWWPYYAAMATAGSLIGGYLTYRLAQREGAEKIEKRVPRKTWQKVQNVFKRWGFGAVATFALLPPPTPMVPVLLAAGVADYSRKKFLGALTTGRGVRYTVIAFLGAMYGRQIIHVLAKHERPFLIGLGICVAAGIAVFPPQVLAKTKNRAARLIRVRFQLNLAPSLNPAPSLNAGQSVRSSLGSRCR